MKPARLPLWKRHRRAIAERDCVFYVRDARRVFMSRPRTAAREVRLWFRLR